MDKPVSQDARPPERISLIMGSHGVRIWTANASLAHRYPDDVVYEYVPATDESLIRSRVLEEAAGVAEQYPSMEAADIPVIRGIASAIRKLSDPIVDEERADGPRG